MAKLEAQEHARGHPMAELDSSQAGLLVWPLAEKLGIARFLLFVPSPSLEAQAGPIHSQTVPPGVPTSTLTFPQQ